MYVQMSMTPNMFALMEVTCITAKKKCETRYLKFVTCNERKRAFDRIVKELLAKPNYGPLVQYPDDNYILYKGKMDDAECIKFTFVPFENHREAVGFIENYFGED